MTITRYRLPILILLTLLTLAASNASLAQDAQAVRTSRDSWGIPSIEGGSITAVYEEFGYVIAVDRLWQFETNRRFSQGKLAEIYGPQLVSSDIRALVMSYSDDEYQTIYDTFSPRSKQLIEAYVEGVNRRIEEVIADPSLLPLEFQMLGINPERIDELDIMAFATSLMRQFGFLGGGEFGNLATIKALKEKFGDEEAIEVFDDLVWLNDPDAPTYVSGDLLSNFVPGADNQQAWKLPTDNPDIDAWVDADNRQDLIANTEARRIGAPLEFGSLSWTLSADKTGTGYPILVGEPQMGYMVPNMFAEVQLRADGLDVAGMTLPLFPAVPIGHNKNIAWSHMVGMGDSVDIYEEKLNPEDRTRYWFNGQWKQMDSRLVKIKVRGEEDREITLFRTIHGPVFSPTNFNPATATSDIAYSRKLVHWMREPLTLQGWMQVNIATNPDEFAAGVAQIMSSLHSTYADIDGNIGYWHTGFVPERPAEYDPRFPLPGTGEAEWGENYLPGVHVLNPAEGFISGWNNKAHPSVRNPFATNQNYIFGSFHRSDWVSDSIKGRTDLDTAANKELIEYLAGAGTWAANQHNGIGLSKQTLLPQLQAAITNASETEKDALQVLQAWDGRSSLDVVDDTLFQAGHVIYLDWVSRLINATFADELAGVQRIRDVDNRLMALLFRSLKDSELTMTTSRNYFDNIDTPTAETQDDIFRTTFQETIAHLADEFGNEDTANWKTERNKVEFRHNMFGKLADMYDSNFGTYVQIIELRPTGAVGFSRWPLGQSSNITAGPDGKPLLDENYLNLLPLYENFEYREK
jgi:penicillin amidase